MRAVLIIGFITVSNLTATATFNCSVSAVGAGYNQSSVYSGPVGVGATGCALQDGNIFLATARANGPTILSLQAITMLRNSGLTLTAFGSLTQSEQYNQLILGGSGDATLRVNYMWYATIGDSTPLGRAQLVDPDPVFAFNGAPAASIKTDFSSSLTCGGFGTCNFWFYTVDMPITFGVPFTRGWTHTVSNYIEVTDRSDWYAGTHAMVSFPPAPAPGFPPMQVLVGGNSVAFSVQDVPEPGTFALFAAGLALLGLRFRHPTR